MPHELLSRPAFTVENFNVVVESLLSEQSKHSALKTDWRLSILSQLKLTDEEKSFLQNLESKSIKVIQSAFNSIIHSGGKIYLQRNTELGTTDVICENIRIFRPHINIRVCRFDGFFKRCKWFPRN